MRRVVGGDGQSYESWSWEFVPRSAAKVPSVRRNNLPRRRDVPLASGVHSEGEFTAEDAEERGVLTLYWLKREFIV